MINVVPWEEASHRKGGASYLSIGVFDGLHRGHQSLIESLLPLGSREREERGIITFHPNPARIVGGASFPGNILTQRLKALLLEHLNVKWMYTIDFSPDFSRIRGENFLDLIQKKLPVRKIAVGQDFHAGYKREISPAVLKEWGRRNGVDVSIHPPVLDQGQPVSSTRIRQAIATGDVQTAARLLGFSFPLDLSQGGRKIKNGQTFITFDETQDGFQVIPPEGRYSVFLDNDVCPERDCHSLFSAVIHEGRISWKTQTPGEGNILIFERKEE